MQPTAVGSSGVPAFLIKLWKLVEDPNYDHLICWNSIGTAFLIRDQARFSKELLPLYFKHSNMASFIRQLNMYGFRKLVSMESGGLRTDNDEMEFQHNYFLKGNANLLDCIKRKVTTLKSSPTEAATAKSQPDLVNKVIFDVKSLHGKQESLDSKLDSMKRENETLWREIAALRQQHIKQQQIVQKLIQFFISLVQPNRGMGVAMKRKMPLMLNASAHSDIRRPRLSRNISFDSGSGGGLDTQKATPPSAATDSTIPAAGPVIHDITDCIDADTFLNTGSGVAYKLDDRTTSPLPLVEPVVNSPCPSSSGLDTGEENLVSNVSPKSLVSTVIDDESTSETVPVVVSSSPTKSSNLDDFLMEIGDNYPAMQTFPTETPSESMNPTNSLDTTLSKVDFVDHIETVNMEIEALKELFSNGDFTIDTSSFLGLFSNEDILQSKGLSDMGDFGKLPSGNEIVGNELTQFSAGGFDLDDSEPNFFINADIGGESSTLPMGQGLYEYADSVVPDENDQGTAIAAPPISTDLALTADFDFLLESPSLLAGDLTKSPGP